MAGNMALPIYGRRTKAELQYFYWTAYLYPKADEKQNIGTLATPEALTAIQAVFKQ
jgi:hypothetical protein